MNVPDTNSEVSLSVVVPVYSGREYLPSLVKEIEALKKRWSTAGLDLVLSEAIFALDAPVDNSRELLHQLSVDRPWIRLVELSRNYGQHSATVAGILYASSDWVVTLDEDLQHRPAHIEAMLARVVPDGLDIVYALPDKPVHGGGYRDLSSRLVKYFISAFSGNRFVSSFNSYRLIRGDIARAASSVCGQHTYFDVALTWFTSRIGAVRIPMSDDRYKQQKKSGYRFRTLLQHAKRLLLTSDFRVIRLTTSLSLTTFLVAVVYAAWVLYSRFLAANPVEVEGWTSLMVVILAFGSVSVFMLGLIIEFLHMSVLQLQGKPAFFVVDRSSDSRLHEAIEKLAQP
jgi:glycosyltransferase involved in cell wall biosynthesis